MERSGDGLLQIRFPFDRSLVDRVKALPRRRWHASERFWSAPEDDVVEVVELLVDEGFQFDSGTQELYIAMGGSQELVAAASAGVPDLPLFFDEAPAEKPSATTAAPDDWSVARLNQFVSDLLAGAFPAPIWIVGEISGFNKNAHRKHVGFELIERDGNSRTEAKASAILFERTGADIERQLKRAGNPFKLEDEIEVRMRVRVDLYAPWGQYRLVIEELDVEYTLGEAARRREQIVRKLTEEGLHQINPSLPLPQMPLRIGLITSLQSDAYNDVLRSFGDSGYAFDITVHGARVQGHSTEPSVLNALDWFAERAEQFDLLLICRGGGSRTDLIWFDNERLGRAVAHFPLPIIIGIGHEQDQSVLDAIARSCKTPTAAAQAVIERVQESDEQTEGVAAALFEAAAAHVEAAARQQAERGQRLVFIATHRLENERSRLNHLRSRCAQAARHLWARERDRIAQIGRRLPLEASRPLGDQQRQLEATVPRLLRAARQRVTQAGQQIDGLERQRRLVDPQRVVERGFAILRDEENRVVPSI